MFCFYLYCLDVKLCKIQLAIRWLYSVNYKLVASSAAATILSHISVREADHRPNPLQETPQASWIRWHSMVRPCLPLSLVVCWALVTPDAPPFLQCCCNGDRWPSFSIRYGVGMLPAMENGQCAAEPLLCTGLLSSHVASADECARCQWRLCGLANEGRCGTCHQPCHSDAM